MLTLISMLLIKALISATLITIMHYNKVITFYKIAAISVGKQNWFSLIAHTSIYNHQLNSLYAAILKVRL